jgi:hypothetical protein
VQDATDLDPIDPAAESPNKQLNKFIPSKMGLDQSETAAPNPFDPSAMRLDQSFVETAGIRKMLTTVPVRKPNAQDFVRVHPDPAYRRIVGLLELKEDRETYLLHPDIAKQLPGECFAAELHTAISRQGVVFLWPVRLQRKDGKQLEWHRSAAEAAELAMHGWVRVKANMAIGAYDIFTPEGVLPEPEWPAVTFDDLLLVAFKVHYIGNLDHSAILRLRGR